MYECMYWDKRWNGESRFRIMQCTHGCCGDVFDQECCSAAVVEVPKDGHVWQTVAAVTAGLLVLSVFIIIIICAVKKNQTGRRRIFTGNRATQETCNPGFSDLEASAPPIPASQYNIFVLSNDLLQGQTNEADVTNRGPVLPHNVHENPPLEPPPSYSSLD